MSIFDFELPIGYTDASGAVQRRGQMRMALALDEIAPLGDPRVQANDAYALILLLARVVVSLGELAAVTPSVIEGLYAADLAYLQELYLQINGNAPFVVATECPTCGQQFSLQVSPLREELAA